MSRHGNRSCFYSPIKCPICPKLHTFDKSHGLKTSTCQCLVIDIAPPAGYRKSNQIKSKSNQINSLLLSHHHSTSALVSENLTSVLQTVQKKKKTQQFTYGQYIFTDCTEDNVQNTHTYTQYTQCTIKTYLVTNTHYTPYVHIYIMYTSMHSNM